MQRQDLLQLIEAALANGQPQYAQTLAQRYLEARPSDLPMQFALARAHALAKDYEAAIALLERIVAVDPECFPAQRLLGEQLLATPKLGQAALALACAYVGDGKPPPSGLRMPEWTGRIRAAYIATQAGAGDRARSESEIALTSDTSSPLPALIHLCAFWHAGRMEQARTLAEKFSAQWPTVVAFKLCLAEGLFQSGDAVRALRLLHDAAAQDTAGQVAARHWGDSHPYTALWDAPPAIDLPAPLPAALITALGLNRLKGTVSKIETPKTAEPSSTQPEPVLSTDLADIQAELDSLADELRGKSMGKAWYVLLTSRKQLAQRFGAESFVPLNNALKQLAEAAAARHGFAPTVLYVDEAESLDKFELQPVNAEKAWDIKLLLHTLNETLATRNDKIGALLIVGGAEVIPFHHLPNPTDDPDSDIPSDNPYATSDENYFIPEWSVGRLPSPSLESLLKTVRAATTHHSQKTLAAKPAHWMMRIWLWVVGQFSKPEPVIDVNTSFGYSANIWKDAAAAVYDAIGNPRDLLTCPPLDTFRLPSEGLAPSRFSYFNLHGVEDGAEWYGQRAATDPDSVPEYPIALRPNDVVNSGRAPQVVFSEACYGANILHKQSHEALCLRFLECGTRAIVGSTKIAYGSIGTPLIGADLLGRFFWQNVLSGLPVGEALRQAKLHLASEMHTRQGCLDAEDQKTLLSFVLYGDPLAIIASTEDTSAKSAKRRLFSTAPQRVSVTDKVTSPATLSPESLATVKNVVARYLPSMRNADVLNAQTRSYQPLGAKSALPQSHTVVTLSKTIRTNTRAHPHYARVTLNSQGKVIKVAVSR